MYCAGGDVIACSSNCLYGFLWLMSSTLFRWMKQNKKGCKLKSIKKMSSRLTEERQTMKKRPYSMVNVLPSQTASLDKHSPSADRHPRSKTFGEGRPPKHRHGRRGSRQKSPGGGTPSPLHGGEEPKRRKKKDDKKRKQDRAQKHSATKENLGSSTSSLNPSQISVPVGAALLEEVDEEDAIQKGAIVSESPARSEYSDVSSVVDVAASLHTYGFRNSGSFSSIKNRKLSVDHLEMRRARSDAHLLNGFGRPSGDNREERHHVCPPERKQFYRQIIRRINVGVRHRIEPASGGMQHFSRLRSENLALDNPYGPMWEQIWKEIQAYLGDMTREEYSEFKYKIGEQIEAIISRISKFKVGCCSPLKGDSSAVHPKTSSLRDIPLQAVAKKLKFHLADTGGSADLSSARDSSGTIVDDGEEEQLPGLGEHRADAGKGVATCSGVNEEAVGKSLRAAAPCESLTSSISNISASKTSRNKYCFNQFLSKSQLLALEEVDCLLDEMYTLESRYPNRKRLRDEHPRYNEYTFKVRHLALTLWFKVTTSLADKLCTLSVWMEVPVIVPDICRNVGLESGNVNITEAGILMSVDSVSPQLSPRSPRVTRGFVLGASDSGSENTPSSSLNKSHGFLRCDVIDTTKSVPSLLGPNANNIDVTKSLTSLQLEQITGPYRNFVNRGLKRRGLTYTVKVCILFS